MNHRPWLLFPLVAWTLACMGGEDAAEPAALLGDGSVPHESPDAGGPDGADPGEAELNEAAPADPTGEAAPGDGGAPAGPALAEIPGWEQTRPQRPGNHDADETDTGCAVEAVLNPPTDSIPIRDAPNVRSQVMGKIHPPIGGARLAVVGRSGDFFEVASFELDDPGDAPRISGRSSGWVHGTAAGIGPQSCSPAERARWQVTLLAEPSPEAEVVTALLEQPLDLLGCEGGWWRVYGPRQDAVGWIAPGDLCGEAAEDAAAGG